MIPKKNSLQTTQDLQQFIEACKHQFRLARYLTVHRLKHKKIFGHFFHNYFQRLDCIWNGGGLDFCDDGIINLKSVNNINIFYKNCKQQRIQIPKQISVELRILYFSIVLERIPSNILIVIRKLKYLKGLQLWGKGWQEDEEEQQGQKQQLIEICSNNEMLIPYLSHLSYQVFSKQNDNLKKLLLQQNPQITSLATICLQNETLKYFQSLKNLTVLELKIEEPSENCSLFPKLGCYFPALKKLKVADKLSSCKHILLEIFKGVQGCLYLEELLLNIRSKQMCNENIFSALLNLKNIKNLQIVGRGIHIPKSDYMVNLLSKSSLSVLYVEDLTGTSGQILPATGKMEKIVLNSPNSEFRHDITIPITQKIESVNICVAFVEKITIQIIDNNNFSALKQLVLVSKDNCSGVLTMSARKERCFEFDWPFLEVFSIQNFNCPNLYKKIMEKCKQLRILLLSEFQLAYTVAVQDLTRLQYLSDLTLYNVGLIGSINTNFIPWLQNLDSFSIILPKQEQTSIMQRLQMIPSASYSEQKGKQSVNFSKNGIINPYWKNPFTAR